MLANGEKEGSSERGESDQRNKDASPPRVRDRMEQNSPSFVASKGKVRSRLLSYPSYRKRPCEKTPDNSRLGIFSVESPMTPGNETTQMVRSRGCWS